jgi:hypothetical protein
MYWQPSQKFLKGFWQLLQMVYICQRASTSSDNLPDDVDYPMGQLAEALPH